MGPESDECRRTDESRRVLVEVGGGDKYFFIRKKAGTDYISSIDKKNGNIKISYPRQGEIASENMIGFHLPYLVEENGPVPLLLHFISQDETESGDPDKLWEVGRVVPQDIDEVRQWAGKVNAFYRQIRRVSIVE